MIPVGARSSPLSRVQVDEVLAEITAINREINFQMIWVETVGDRDKQTSLRNLEKTDFFTRELDQLLLSGAIRIAIHSAKDLPDPLPPGIAIAALTKGVDARDSLVLPEGHTLATLPPHARIATSSERREEMVRTLRSDLQFVDIRGTIGERLKKLDTREVSGVVIAEAALIRLNLTHLNRIFLPGKTTPLQGRLAILTRTTDRKMKTLFSTIDHEHSLPGP